MKHVRFISSLALAAISATLSLALMQSAIANAAVNATLVSITSDWIKLEKFNGGDIVSCGINGFTQEEPGPCITIERVFHPIEAKAVSVKTSILN